MAGAELGRPGRGAGFVGLPAPVDDDDLVAAATLVHHRRGRRLGGPGGVLLLLLLLLQSGRASVQLNEHREHQPQNAAAAAVQR